MWIVTKHDPVQRVVEFARFTPAPAGPEFLDGLTEEEFRRAAVNNCLPDFMIVLGVALARWRTE